MENSKGHNQQNAVVKLTLTLEEFRDKYTKSEVVLV
jgi:hypothetical protein